MLSPAAIRQLFLDPQPSYSLADAAALLGSSAHELKAAVDLGEAEAVQSPAGIALPWAEVVSMALERWSQEVMETALGTSMNGTIPPLVRLTELRVRLPRFEVVALQKVAAQEGRSVSDVLARELLDFVSARADWLERDVAGFAHAMNWPA